MDDQAAEYPSIDELVRGLGAFCLVVCVIVIFFVGTFPFDFTFGHDSWQFEFDWNWLQWDPHYVDRTQNVLLFMPFGFALAATLRPRRWGAGWRVGLALLLGGSFSFSIEFLQEFVSFRDPALMDMWTNTLGSVCGAIVYLIVGRRSLNLAARTLLALRPLGKPWIIVSLLGIYSLVQLIGPTLVRNPGDLSVWDANLPLMVGNELSGEHFWDGVVSDIVLSDRAIDGTQAMKLFNGTSVESIFNDSLLGHYVPRGGGPYPDLAGHLPALQWAQSALRGLGNEPPPIHSHEYWLTTAGPITYANQRIMRSSQFTLAATVTPYSLLPRGPTRFLSIATDNNNRNVQFSQEHEDLSIRVRNAVRVMPDMHLHAVFDENRPVQIILTAQDARVVVYIDGKERGNLLVTPEAKMIWRLYPRGGFWTRMEKYEFRSYAAIYRAIVLIPFSALLGAALMLSHLSAGAKRWIAIIAVLVMAIALEIVLGTLGNGFQPLNLLISLVIGWGMLDQMARWRRRRRESALDWI